MCCAQGDASVEGAGRTMKCVAVRFSFVVLPVAVLYERLMRVVAGDDGGAVAAGAVTR